jgi:hypothetical protein
MSRWPTVRGGLLFGVRLAARLTSLSTSAAFLFIIFLEVTNADELQPAALPVIVLLALTILAGWTAWRWERAGGGLMIAGALALSLATYTAATAFGFGAEAVLAPLIYGLPLLMTGVGFLLCGQLSCCAAVQR